MVLDASVITRLARDLESFPDALAFVEQYTAMLDDRIEAMHAELTSPATSDRLTALLSLHTSSVMAGAAQLQHTTERAIATLRTGTLTAQQVTILHRRLILQARDFTEAHDQFRAGSLLVINPARHFPNTSTRPLEDRDDDHQ